LITTSEPSGAAVAGNADSGAAASPNSDAIAVTRQPRLDSNIDLPEVSSQ
jgi:hypothetical protein